MSSSRPFSRNRFRTSRTWFVLLFFIVAIDEYVIKVRCTSYWYSSGRSQVRCITQTAWLGIQTDHILCWMPSTIHAPFFIRMRLNLWITSSFVKRTELNNLPRFFFYRWYWIPIFDYDSILSSIIDAEPQSVPPGFPFFLLFFGYGVVNFFVGSVVSKPFFLLFVFFFFWGAKIKYIYKKALVMLIVH